MKYKKSNNNQVGGRHDLLTKIMIRLSGGLVVMTLMIGFILASSTTSANSTASANASVTVTVSCTLSGGASGTGDAGEYTYSGNVTPGTTSTITGSKLSAVCNDASGYSIYAIGYSGDSYDAPTNTQMLGTDSNISTGTNTSGNSSWAMKVNPVSGSAPTITNNFNNFHVVPEDYTQVAKYTSSTASPTSTGAQVQTTYQIYSSAIQAPGTYTGKVKYTMVHPNDAPAPTPPVYMQDATLADCGKTMYDSRDEKDYTTTLINGQCWMTQNLRITGTISADLSNFSGSDFDVSQYSLASSDSSYSGHCDSTNGYNYACAKDSDSTDYGVWYNYVAASAGTIKTDNNSTDATSDICPSGWRLPTNSEFSGITSSSSAFSPVYGGYYGSGTLRGASNEGDWWSSTADNAAGRSILYYGNGGLYIDFGNRYNGYSVRCVMKSPSMQNVDASTLASMLPNVGDTITLPDERDGEEYLIGKLADGNYWMLDNLRLGGTYSMTLTPADTNIASNFTLPASTTSGFTNDTTGYTQPAVNADYKNTTTTSYGAGSGKIGNYYNICAASAGTYCYAEGSGTGNATHDICPAGWRMPTGGDYQEGSGVGDGEYFALGTALGLTFDEDVWEFPGTTYQTALSTPLSGFFYLGSARGQGSNGRFWSSTYGDGSSMYSLYVDSSNVYPTNGDNRYRGQSLRCLLGS